MNLTLAAFILLNYPPGNHWILFAFVKRRADLCEIFRNTPTYSCEYPNFIHKCPFSPASYGSMRCHNISPGSYRFNLIFAWLVTSQNVGGRLVQSRSRAHVYLPCDQSAIIASFLQSMRARHTPTVFR